MKIICLHQSAELYGSDRSFLQVVNYLTRRTDVTEVKVLLPMSGPLVSALEKCGAIVEITSLCVLRKVWVKKLQLGKLLFPLFKLPKKYSEFKKYDIVYCNTTVIMDFYLLSLILNNRKILHVREIPGKCLTRFFTWFINKGKILALYNSKSTEKAFFQVKNGKTVYNAFEGFRLDEKKIYDIESRPLRLLIVGRINNWKGQDFIINALSRLDRGYSYELQILGSVFEGNEYLLEELKSKVRDYGLDSRIKFVDFVADPEPYYQWSDILIVPSKKPEPFGRIAIEAMSLAKPVIAANHGGLIEIVDDKVTGYLFEANNEDSFLKYITHYLEHKNEIVLHGKNGRKRFLEYFSLNSLYNELDDIF